MSFSSELCLVDQSRDKVSSHVDFQGVWVPHGQWPASATYSLC